MADDSAGVGQELPFRKLRQSERILARSVLFAITWTFLHMNNGYAKRSQGELSLLPFVASGYPVSCLC